jgi:ribosomal protein S19E (S16A)
MACLKPETFLTEEEIIAYLQALADKPLEDIELSKQIKHPLFKVRGTVRELERLGFLLIEDEKNAVTEKGYTFLREGTTSSAN